MNDNAAVNNSIYDLLSSWNLRHLNQHFIDHGITLDVLKILKPKHVEILFNGLAVGDLAIFENHLENWKSSNATVSIPTVSILAPIKYSFQPKTHSVITMLRETHNGKSILKYYDEKKILHDEQRQLLIKTIALYVEAKGLTCSVSDCLEMENEICLIFPTEELEYYNTGKRGKLYSKIYNLKRHSKNIFDSKIESTNENDIGIISETDAISALQILRTGNVSADEFDLYWKKCANFRFKQIEESKTTDEILKQWPEYLKPYGFKLIEMDFQIKYVEAKDIASKWSLHEKRFLDVLKKKLTSAFVSKQLNDIISCDEESKQFGIFWHLHSLFPPQQKTVTDDLGAKIKKKFSILDSQESFAIIANSEKELNIKIDLLKFQSKNIQPRLLVVGSTTEVKQIFLYFDDIKYPILKVLTAVDILFKIFFVFNLEFPKESEIFFNFLQIFFYEIPSDKKFTKIYTIKNEILNLPNI